MYIVKQVLLHREQCDIKARPNGAAQVVRVAEALKRLGYLTYVKYQTKTVIGDNNRLQRFIIVTVKKTKDFQKLYDKREEERKKIIEEIQKNEDKKGKN